MRVAWHPESNQFVKASDIERVYGERTAEFNDHYEKPPSVCRVCGNDLILIKGKPKIVAHFRHPVGMKCPTTEPNGKQYLRLRPTDPDREAGAKIRRIVVERWQELYVELQRLVPYFSPTEFKTLLRRATDQRTWDYRGLTFADLPRTMIMLLDYTPWTGEPGRLFWFRFWYENGVQTFEDLWIRPSSPPVLFRASFEPPAARGRRPKYEDVVAIKDEWKIPDWIPPIRQNQIEEIEIWFARHRPDFPLI